MICAYTVWTDQNKAESVVLYTVIDVRLLLGTELYAVISSLWIYKHWVTVQKSMVDMVTPPEAGKPSEEHSAYWIFADGPGELVQKLSYGKWLIFRFVMTHTCMVHAMQVLGVCCLAIAEHDTTGRGGILYPLLKHDYL